MIVIKMLIAKCDVVELGERMFLGDNRLENLIIENVGQLTINRNSLAFQHLATVILLHVKKITFDHSTFR